MATSARHTSTGLNEHGTSPEAATFSPSARHNHHAISRANLYSAVATVRKDLGVSPQNCRELIARLTPHGNQQEAGGISLKRVGEILRDSGATPHERALAVALLGAVSGSPTNHGDSSRIARIIAQGAQQELAAFPITDEFRESLLKIFPAAIPHSNEPPIPTALARSVHSNHDIQTDAQRLVYQCHGDRLGDAIKLSRDLLLKSDSLTPEKRERLLTILDSITVKCDHYVQALDKYVRFEHNERLKLHLEREDYQHQFESNDTSRQLAHNAFISELNIFFRNALKLLPEERQALTPIAQLLTGDPKDARHRGRTGEYAILHVYFRAKDAGF